MKTLAPPPEPFVHGWANTSLCWPEDVLLRSWGFRIERRPRNGPAVWSRKGEEMTHAVALALVRIACREVEKRR